MKDMQAYLEKLREQASECELIRDSATDRQKRELFARLAQHFQILAGEIEKSMSDQTPITSSPGRNTQKPFPKE